MLADRRRSILSVFLAEWRREKARKGMTVEAIGQLRQPNAPPASWGKIVAAWAWRERAAAWDAYQRQIEDEEFDQERRQDRRNRINTNRALRGWAVSQIPNLPKELCARCGHLPHDAIECRKDDCRCADYLAAPADPYAVIAAMKLANQELRKEYGDEPAQRHQLEHSGTVANVELQMTPNDLADKTDEELEDEIRQFAALLSHLTPGAPAGTSTPAPDGTAPDDPGGQGPPLDEP
jgi:hypothetical protein